MKITPKSALTAVLVLAVSGSLPPVNAFADGSVYYEGTYYDYDNLHKSGECGDQTTWEWDGETGTMTIRGTGDMWDFDWWNGFTELPPPWRINSYLRLPIPPNDSIIIEDGVTSVGDRSFYFFDEVTTVQIPDSVTRIGVLAFAEMTILPAIKIPASVANIDTLAFSACESLTDVILPEGVTTIGDRAFSNCSSLASITIPASAANISRQFLLNCTSLRDVYYNGSREQWDQLGLSNLVISHDYSSNPIETITLSDTKVTVHFGSGETLVFSGADGPGDGEPDDNEPGNSDNPDDDDEPGDGEPDDDDEPGDDDEPDDDEPDDDDNSPSYLDDMTETLIQLSGELDEITDPDSAARAVEKLLEQMTKEQRQDPDCIDLATLYAETAVSKAAQKSVSGSSVLISADSVADLEAIAAEAGSAVRKVLADGEVSLARALPCTVTMTAGETAGAVSLDPSILATSVDKIRMETPDYALTFRVSDFRKELDEVLTFSAEDTAGPAGTAVSVQFPGELSASPIVVSLPRDNTDDTYQAIVSDSGEALASKVNPALNMIDGRINTSGTYHVQVNQIDFTDIENKSTQMQEAIRYLASRGILEGTSTAAFSPDDNISRAEIAALLVRMLGKLDPAAKTDFQDVTPSDWYYAAVGSAQRLTLFPGYEDSTFRGTRDIQRVQLIAAAGRILISEMDYEIPADVPSCLSGYRDLVAVWAQPLAALTTSENLVVPQEDGTFAGEQTITRGDAAVLLYRLFQRIW